MMMVTTLDDQDSRNFTCSTRQLCDSTVRIVDYNKADWEGIRDVLGRVEWDDWLTDNATTEENLDTFTTIIESACKGIPTRKKTRRRRSVWMNRKARKAIRKKTKTWKRCRQTCNAERPRTISESTQQGYKDSEGQVTSR